MLEGHHDGGLDCDEGEEKNGAIRKTRGVEMPADVRAGLESEVKE